MRPILTGDFCPILTLVDAFFAERAWNVLAEILPPWTAIFFELSNPLTRRFRGVTILAAFPIGPWSLL